MADISVTAGNVLAASDATIVHGTSGETITAGQCVYLKASDNRYWLTDGDAAATAAAAGASLVAASAGQPLAVCTGGNINLGATLAIGEPYWVSLAAGGICPFADIAVGDFTTFLGIATTASNLKMSICIGGVAQAA